MGNEAVHETEDLKENGHELFVSLTELGWFYFGTDLCCKASSERQRQQNWKSERDSFVSRRANKKTSADGPLVPGLV